MKSKASLFGHPLHPILVTFPIAFLLGAFICDVAVITADILLVINVAYVLNIAGLVMGLLAMFTGMIDFYAVIPERSSAKRTAIMHFMANVIMMALFWIAFVLRLDTGAPSVWTVMLETIGAIAILIAGWFGGRLVFKHRIGVNG